MEIVIHQPEQLRFVIVAEGREAVLQYKLLEQEGRTEVDFYSTFVPPEFRGKGFAEQLVRSGMAWAKEQGITVHASCWYAAKFIRCDRFNAI